MNTALAHCPPTTLTISMLKTVVDHFRCPDELIGRVKGSLSSATPSRNVAAGNGKLDLDEQVRSLLLESYAGLMGEETTKLGGNAFLRNVYYLARPVLPVSVRSRLQGLRLRSQLKREFPSWPVDRSADLLCEEGMKSAIRANNGEPIPFIWFWPHGKQSALILTHDVESEVGKSFCSSLMDIDDEFGFKASFQIVPEERYPVEPEFLRQFKDRGYEICVHDLSHDGDLYRDRQEFGRRAKRINDYCRTFGTRGFRSGVLYRNLRWYGEYDFSYDMSVPTVGHLEAQCGGCCSVLPYFIGNILEIPVTTAQDYSIIYILHQHSIDLWKQQTEKIIDGHGLLSFIAHPDYLIHAEAQALYRELLVYLAGLRDNGDIWSTVPSEIDIWWRQRNAMNLTRNGGKWEISGDGSDRATLAFASLRGDSLVYTLGGVATGGSLAFSGVPFNRNGDLGAHGSGRGSQFEREITATAVLPPFSVETEAGETAIAHTAKTRKAARIAMVSYSFYENDNRILRYATTLAQRGDHVDVFALRAEGLNDEQIIDGVNVYRIQDRVRNEKNRYSYAWRIAKFFFRAMYQVARHDWKDKYDLIHVHSVPDSLVFSALPAKLRGTPVILDIHDILPEFYASKFSIRQESPMFKALLGVEKVSSGFADHVIIANHIWAERLSKRSVSPEKCTVIINSPDRSVFTSSGARKRNDGRVILLYPGSLNWHQGLDIAIRAFGKIAKDAPEADFHIYGEGPAREGLVELAKELGLEGRVVFEKSRALKEIATVIEQADIGIVPKRKDNFGNEAFSTKIMEFMSLGVPVIVSDTKIDQYYFNDSLVRFFPGGDENELARAMLDLIRDPERRKRQAERAFRFVEENDWEHKKKIYLDLVDGLLRRQN